MRYSHERIYLFLLRNWRWYRRPTLRIFSARPGQFRRNHLNPVKISPFGRDKVSRFFISRFKKKYYWKISSNYSDHRNTLFYSCYDSNDCRFNMSLLCNRRRLGLTSTNLIWWFNVMSKAEVGRGVLVSRVDLRRTREPSQFHIQVLVHFRSRA